MISLQKSWVRMLPSILFWGALWGMFEATAGYLMHLLPVSIGAYVWFPAAYLFMAKIYNSTRSRGAIAAIAFLSAAIKLFNLLTGIRMDYVINPAVSIILESFAMVCVIRISINKSNKSINNHSALHILIVNTLWRLMYIVYIAAIAPVWIRDVSVISNISSLLGFIAVDNIVSTIVCVVMMKIYYIIKSKSYIYEQKPLPWAMRFFAACTWVSLSVLLQFVF